MGVSTDKEPIISNNYRLYILGSRFVRFFNLGGFKLVVKGSCPGSINRLFDLETVELVCRKSLPLDAQIDLGITCYPGDSSG